MGARDFECGRRLLRPYTSPSVRMVLSEGLPSANRHSGCANQMPLLTGMREEGRTLTNLTRASLIDVCIQTHAISRLRHNPAMIMFEHCMKVSDDTIKHALFTHHSSSRSLNTPIRQRPDFTTRSLRRRKGANRKCFFLRDKMSFETRPSAPSYKRKYFPSPLRALVSSNYSNKHHQKKKRQQRGGT